MSAVVTAEPHGIHVIDTGFVRPHFDAAYLVAEGGRGAFIDTGTSYSLPRLLGAIDSAGLSATASTTSSSRTCTSTMPAAPAR